MTDDEKVVQLLIVELEQSLDKLEAVARGFNESIYASATDMQELFQWALDGIHVTIQAFKDFKAANDPELGGPLALLFELSETLYQVSCDDCWKYETNLRLVIALRIILRVLKEEMEELSK